MQKLEFHQTEIPGLVQIKPFCAPDHRGYLLKSYEHGIFREHGIVLNPYEELTSCSKKGVLRGLHFQREYSQSKLVRVLHGRVYDVAVDLRRNSPTFGKWKGFFLSAEGMEMLYLPEGFAHGFLALEETTVFSYLCGDRYDPDSDGGIVWNDPELNITWPVEQVEQVILTDKDRAFPTLAEWKAQYGGLDYGV